MLVRVKQRDSILALDKNHQLIYQYELSGIRSNYVCDSPLEWSTGQGCPLSGPLVPLPPPLGSPCLLSRIFLDGGYVSSSPKAKLGE